METADNKLNLGGIPAETLADEFGTPLYVYEEAVIRERCRELRMAFSAIGPQIHYAIKANFNPAILAVVLNEGMGVDAVSPNEVRLALEVGFLPDQILFTGNNTSETEMREVVQLGVPVNVGSLGELDRFGRLNPGGRVSVRINPDVGDGHHHHVITGGPDSKFGVYHTETARVEEILIRHRLTLTGIHSHIGTGILQTGQMVEAMEIILRAAARFPNLEFINFGGGFGIPYRPESPPLPLARLGEEMAERFFRFQRGYGQPLNMKLEPGRFLVAQAGTLLTRVTNIQATPAHTFVGCDSGFNHLARPILYGAYHRVVNASRMEGETITAAIAGNICESGDVFTQDKNGIEDRPITAPREGDLLALLDVGAYGMALASQYNLRARPAEVMVNNGKAKLIRNRETYESLVRDFLPFPSFSATKPV